ncbi:MAG: acyl-CoA dehydratase activase [Candidatus Neomarinimicrobiota bacterium]
MNSPQKIHHYLGIDLGSSYTKFAVVDDNSTMIHKQVIPSLSRRRENFNDVLSSVNHLYNIHKVCTTGYGRNSHQGDLQKTELICASIGVSRSYPERKCIIDIGGEDIKIIESGASGEVLNFHMNDKCSAGTGAFITEIAKKAELEIEEMSDLARKSNANRIINSFCTVFAKTEILGWKFDGVPIEDIAQGIYLSITDRIGKMPIPPDLPVFLCGGVVTYHPYMQELLVKNLRLDVQITSEPLFAVANGAALLAQSVA